jgi:ABC-type sugar transport system ATPase subunit
VASVTFEGVSKRYDDVMAVDHLDLSVVDGEFMILLGPSGCGKTTALRMIAGLEDITSGTVSIGDRVVNDVEPAKRDVSMVFQSYALYPHMTVRRNIESPLLVRKYSVDGADTAPRKLTKAERTARVDEAAAVLDLTPYLDRKPAALSGGQRQRVALARAFVGRPQAFLMDEPLSNLDAKLRAQTRLELVDLHRRVETTVVYVTHDQVEAMTMADRIAIMADGHLQQVGTPQDVYEAPANLFVARFIGTPPMNTLPGTFTSAGGWPAISVGDSRFPVPPEGPGSPDGLAEGRPVVVGVRPEHLLAGLDGAVSATVVAVEWLGHECLIFAKVGEHDVTVREPGLSPYKAGDVIKLSAEPRQVHLFDPDTTNRLA